MAFFNGWPWTQFQEQNLDWLIKQVKANTDVIADIDQTIETHVDDKLQEWLDDGTITALVSQALDDFEDTVNQALLTMSGTVDKKVWRVPYLKAIDFTAVDGDIVVSGGFNAAGDHGGGVYVVDSNSGILSNGVRCRPVIAESSLSLNITADGVTDNTVQLRTALNWVDHIDFLPSDIVLLSGIITLHNGVSFDGHGCTFLARLGSYTSKQSMLYAVSFKDITIKNITFNRQSAAVDFYAASILNSDNINISGCNCLNGLGYMLRLNNSTNVKVTDCSGNNINGLSGNPGGLIYQQGGTDLVFDNIKTSQIQDHAVYLDGTTEISNVTISNITCSDHLTTTLTNAAGVVLYGNVHDFIIETVKVYNIKNGVMLSSRDSAIPRNGIIRACDLNSCWENGITIHGDSSTNTISAYIKVFDNIIAGPAQDAITIRNGRNYHVAENWLHNITRYGIETSGITFVNIENNTIQICSDTGVVIGNNEKTQGARVQNNVFYNMPNAIRNPTVGSVNNYISNNINISVTNPDQILAGNFTNTITWTAT